MLFTWFKQIAHRDFDSKFIYAPVCGHEMIRTLITKVAAQDLIFEGAHISNAYLYGKRHMSRYMEQPTNSTGLPLYPEYICKLEKYIYRTSKERQYADLPFTCNF